MRQKLFIFGVLALLSIFLFGCAPRNITGRAYTTLNPVVTSGGQVIATREANCTPNCVKKQCGDDGCGGSCGSCGVGQTCILNVTSSYCCLPNCAGKQCGSNGCGGSCGSCSLYQTCTNGICVNANCTDSDKGLVYTTYGSVRKGSYYKADNCPSTSVLKEQYCKNNNPAEQSYNCTINPNYVCYGGACKLKCTDTDGGKIYTVKGSVKLGTTTKGTDSCLTNQTLREYYCSSIASHTYTSYKCPRVCSGGACI